MEENRSNCASSRPSILGLPVELVNLKFSALERDAILSLRRTCKGFNKIFIEHQSSYFFEAVTTTLSRRSLEDLRKAMRCSDIANRVRTLRIAVPDSYGMNIKRFGRGFYWN